MNVHTVTVQFDVEGLDGRDAAITVCRRLEQAELVDGPLESWSLPYFPEVDGSDPRSFPETDRRDCGCPFDLHVEGCRAGESQGHPEPSVPSGESGSHPGRWLGDVVERCTCGEVADYFLHLPASDCIGCRAPLDHHRFTAVQRPSLRERIAGAIADISEEWAEAADWLAGRIMDGLAQERDT